MGDPSLALPWPEVDGRICAAASASTMRVYPSTGRAKAMVGEGLGDGNGWRLQGWPEVPAERGFRWQVVKGLERAGVEQSAREAEFGGGPL